MTPFHLRNFYMNLGIEIYNIQTNSLLMPHPEDLTPSPGLWRHYIHMHAEKYLYTQNTI